MKQTAQIKYKLIFWPVQCKAREEKTVFLLFIVGFARPRGTEQVTGATRIHRPLRRDILLGVRMAIACLSDSRHFVRCIAVFERASVGSHLHQSNFIITNLLWRFPCHFQFEHWAQAWYDRFVYCCDLSDSSLARDAQRMHSVAKRARYFLFHRPSATHNRVCYLHGKWPWSGSSQALVVLWVCVWVCMCNCVHMQRSTYAIARFAENVMFMWFIVYNQTDSLLFYVFKVFPFNDKIYCRMMNGNL